MALSDNLVSYWSLESDATDAHGTNDLTNNNSVTFVSGKVGNCGDFESTSSQYLSIADNADLSTGDIDFTIACWVNFETLLATEMDIVSKFETVGNQREYRIRYLNTSTRLTFAVSSSGASGAIATATANNLGAPSTATWYFIVAWHDATANTINIQVNNGTADSTAHSLGVFDGTSPFHIGSLGRAGAVAFPFDGLIDEVGLWKRVLTSDERTDLYNSGNGRDYAYITGAVAAARSGHRIIGGGAFGRVIGG